MNRRREKNTYSQTSRLENPEKLQLHHDHEKFLFLTVELSSFEEVGVSFVALGN
jgi:hypothetical protein